MNRKGEKIGWIGGWLGGFIWLSILSVLWLIQGKFKMGILGMSLFTLAVVIIFTLTPWKFPRTKYWKLMLPIYSVFISSVIIAINAFGGLEGAGLNWFSFGWIIPCFIPFGTIGNRTWHKMDG